MKWNDRKTTPPPVHEYRKDTEFILVYDASGDNYMNDKIYVDWYGYKGRDEFDNKIYGYDEGWTHWMPLPDAPQDNNVEILNNNQHTKA